MPQQPFDLSSVPRDSRRVPIATKVTFKFERFAGFISEYSANISPTGMFITTNQPEPPGSVLDFEFQLGDGFEIIQGKGEVVWIRAVAEGPSRPAGMGIRFLELSEGSKELIYRIVDQYVQDGGTPFDVSLRPPDPVQPLPRTAVRSAASPFPDLPDSGILRRRWTPPPGCRPSPTTRIRSRSTTTSRPSCRRCRPWTTPSRRGRPSTSAASRRARPSRAGARSSRWRSPGWCWPWPRPGSSSATPSAACWASGDEAAAASTALSRGRPPRPAPLRAPGGDAGVRSRRSPRRTPRPCPRWSAAGRRRPRPRPPAPDAGSAPPALTRTRP